MSTDGLMVSVSGIRGRIGEGLTADVVCRYAAGFGAWSLARHRGRTIVVGRDSRVSGPMVHRIVLGALQAVGADVIDLGVVPTPTVQLAVEHHHAAGGLAITASHNPIEWNALKFIGASGLFLDPAESAAMRAALESATAWAKWDAIGAVRADPDAVHRHVRAILALPLIDVEGIRGHAYRVGLDCVRGAGAGIMLELLSALGCRVRAIHLEADGRFPREPEPVAEHLGELERLVLDEGADVGFAVDPDVDRLALVSDAGAAIGEDYTLALAARVVLRHRPGAVVTNLSTSRVVDDAAAAEGRRVIRAPVGEVNVAVRMRQESAPIGGEGNGGVILPELHLGRDAPAGAALILQLMHETGRRISELVAAAPRYVIVKDKLDRPNAALDAVYDALRSAFPGSEEDTQDGLRLAWPDRWLHVRPSGTEPIVRVIAEAPTAAEAKALVARARQPLDALAAAGSGDGTTGAR